VGLFLPNDEFAYVAANGKILHVDGTDINDRGPWQYNVAYNFNDVILWQNSLYVALQPNLNQPPTANQDDFWSVLVKTASGATNLTLEGLYGSIVYVGSIANEALTVANIAYDIAININPIEGDRLLYGGNAVWVSGYTFDVQPTGVSFFGTTYAYAGTTVTLHPSDPTNDRIDLIVATTAGTIGVITGTPSIPPAPPGYDPSATFELTPITVGHNTTQPSVQNVVIYDENTGPPAEWTFTGTSAFINPNDTLHPHTGLKDIAANFAPAGDGFSLVAGAPVNLDNFSVLYLYVRPQATWSTTAFLRLNWLDTNNNWVGSYAVIQNGLNGFSNSNPNYQLMVLPISAFGVPSGTFVTALQFTVFCKSTLAFNLDTIGLQYGVSQPPVVIPDATTSTKGVVLLEPNGGTLPGRAVTGDDYRLSLFLSGTWPIPNGIQADTVTGLNLRSTPKAVVLTVQTPPGGGQGLAAELASKPTTDGWDYYVLPGMTDVTGYVLHYIIGF